MTMMINHVLIEELTENKGIKFLNLKSRLGFFSRGITNAVFQLLGTRPVTSDGRGQYKKS